MVNKTIIFSTFLFLFFLLNGFSQEEKITLAISPNIDQAWKKLKSPTTLSISGLTNFATELLHTHSQQQLQLKLDQSPQDFKNLLSEVKIDDSQDFITGYLQNLWCQEKSCVPQISILLKMPALKQQVLASSGTQQALFYALVSDQKEVAFFLIDLGCDLNQRIFSSNKTLFMGLVESNPSLAQAIAEKYPHKIDWDAKDQRGNSARSLWQAISVPKTLHSQKALIPMWSDHLEDL